MSFSGDLNHLDETSDGFPRFDRWLASELTSTRSLRVVPSIAVKVNGYIERCTRDGKAPRGRFILATIAKHFDLDRARGSMLTASALLSLEPAGLGVAQVQDFASKVTQTMSAVPSDELPSDRLLGEWLFSKVRNFRKLERHIENIKDSPKDSTMRGFDFLWSKLQDTLSYEREDLNAKDVQDHFRKMSPGVKASGVPAPKTPSPSPPTPKGAGSPPSLPSGLAAYAPPGGKGGDDSPSKKKGKGKGKKGAPLTKEQKAQKPCIFFQMDSGCHHGEKCEYAHVKTGTKPGAKPAAAKPKPKAMPAFAVAMIASAMAGVSQAANTVTVEWGADTCAGRHLASSKALGSQGIPSSMYNSCIGTSSDPIAFATGGGTKYGNDTLNLHMNGWGVANCYMLEDCPIVRSVGLDVESDGKAFIWLPGQLPYFAKNASDIKVVCSEENKLYAHRIEENVPIFRSTVQFTQGMAAHVASESAIDSMRVEPPASVPEPADAPASSSVAPAPPPSVAEAPKEAPSHIERVRIEASSQQHQLSHFPKNPFCDICNQAKLYAKRVRSKRIEPIDLPEPAAFGQQLALDHLIVHKTASSNKEFVVLLVRDMFSKVLQAYPSTTKNSDHVYQSLKKFVGVALAKNPALSSNPIRPQRSSKQFMTWDGCQIRVSQPAGLTILHWSATCEALRKLSVVCT